MGKSGAMRSIRGTRCRHDVAIPRRDAPELVHEPFRPTKGVALPQEGAGNAGCPLHPQPRVVW
jgi:hypothetical protein